MENSIFRGFLRILGDILEDFWRSFEEFWRNWFVVRRLRTSVNRIFLEDEFVAARPVGFAAGKNR